MLGLVYAPLGECSTRRSSSIRSAAIYPEPSPSAFLGVIRSTPAPVGSVTTIGASIDALRPVD